MPGEPKQRKKYTTYLRSANVCTSKHTHGTGIGRVWSPHMVSHYEWFSGGRRQQEPVVDWDEYEPPPAPVSPPRPTAAQERAAAAVAAAIEAAAQDGDGGDDGCFGGSGGSVSDALPESVRNHHGTRRTVNSKTTSATKLCSRLFLTRVEVICTRISPT